MISEALYALGAQLEFDKIKELKKVNMIFIKNGEINLKMLDYPTLANYAAICFYDVSRWRQKYNSADGAICMIILEELCHHFYTDDEELVKTPVFNVMKRIFPELKIIEDIYPKK